MIHTAQPWRHEVADHLEAIVRILRSDGESPEETAPATRGGEDPQEPVGVAKRIHPALGGTQERVLAQVAEAHPDGISAGDVARALGMESPNAHLTLVSLVRHRLVRKDETTHPQLYFLGPRILAELN